MAFSNRGGHMVVGVLSRVVPHQTARSAYFPLVRLPHGYAYLVGVRSTDSRSHWWDIILALAIAGAKSWRVRATDMRLRIPGADEILFPFKCPGQHLI
jgi:hypothetical protein